MQALRTAATGMAAQQLNVEVISNNIANMNTIGFKKQRAEFQDLLYQTLQQAGPQSSDQGCRSARASRRAPSTGSTPKARPPPPATSLTWPSTAAASSRS